MSKSPETEGAQSSGQGGLVVAAAGQRIRICVRHATTIRSLLWLKVSKDGSLYTGYSAPPLDRCRRLIPTPLSNGGVRFEWAVAEEVEVPQGKRKASFHASGVINAYGARSVGVNLRLVQSPTFLCIYLPSHPNNWREIGEVRARDILVSDLLQDECPIIVQLHYQRTSQWSLIPSRLEEGLFVLPVGFTDLADDQRILLHLGFWRSPKSQRWPPRSIISWPYVAGRDRPSSVEQWVE